MRTMIHLFTCENFYSFSGKTTFSFKVNNNAPKNNGYFTTPSDNRLSKTETVIGANASGKTNLLKVLPFLKWLIVDSFNRKPGNPIIIRPFTFGEEKNKPTKLSVVFETNKKIYTYKIAITKERILSEELKATSFVNEKKSTKKLFSRTWDQKKGHYNFDGENFKLPKGVKNLLRANASVISTTSRLNHAESQIIAQYWGQIETNVIEAGWVGDSLLPNANAQLLEAFDFFSENSALKKEVEELLSRFDLGLSGFEIKKEKEENGFSLTVRAKHLFNGQKEYLPVQYESSGTKQMFVLLRRILAALKKGSIAILDEFDVNLHPEIVMALYDLFSQPKTNPKNAQLIMSTHNHILLNSLDKYQIILVEKNKDGVSEAWRLDEMEDIRADENYYSKYIAGAYGAVPEI